MTKRQIIDEIIEINSTAQASFLCQFGEEDLTAYLTRLHLLMQPRLTGDVARYRKYFDRHDAVAAAPAKPARPAASLGTGTWRAEEVLPAVQPLPVEADLADEPAEASQATLFPAHA